MDYAVRKAKTVDENWNVKKMPVEKEEIVVKRAPLFPKPTTSVSPTDFLRNFWCRHYDTCLKEASDRHSYLSCSLCRYKSSHHFDGTFESPLPSHHFPRL